MFVEYEVRGMGQGEGEGEGEGGEGNLNRDIYIGIVGLCHNPFEPLLSLSYVVGSVRIINSATFFTDRLHTLLFVFHMIFRKSQPPPPPPHPISINK